MIPGLSKSREDFLNKFLGLNWPYASYVLYIYILGIIYLYIGYYIFIYWVLYPTRGKHLTSVYNICPLFFNTKENSNLENVEGNIKKFLSPLSFPAFVPKIKACMPYCKFLSSLWKIPAERQLHAVCYFFSCDKFRAMNSPTLW